MKIINLKLKDIKPYEKNPRKNEKAVEFVANSIKEFGFKNPIILDKNNIIVCGHTRYKASIKLGLTEVPCVIADDLTNEQIKAFRLADNKTAEKSEWDFDLLNKEIKDILNIDLNLFDLKITEDIDLDDFFEDVEEKQKEKKHIVCPHCGLKIEE